MNFNLQYKIKIYSYVLIFFFEQNQFIQKHLEKKLYLPFHYIYLFFFNLKNEKTFFIY